MLWEAQQSGYAIPAFNYTDIWEFLAITEAAEELDAPVYAATAKDTVDALGVDICGSLGKIEYAKTNGNFFNHLDHCTMVDRCTANPMRDASARSRQALPLSCLTARICP